MTTAASSIAELIANADTHVVLGLRSAAQTAPVVVQRWSRGDGDLRTSVTFGPYPQRVDADAILVHINGGPADVVPLHGRMTLPAGVTFTYDLTLSVRAGV